MVRDQQALSALGAWFLAKWRGRLADSGDVHHTARMMRKQGIPLEVAVVILLCGADERQAFPRAVGSTPTTQTIKSEGSLDV
jgi:hypothetical protein